MTQTVLWVSGGQLVTWTWRQEREDFLEAVRFWPDSASCFCMSSSSTPSLGRGMEPPVHRAGVLAQDV